jgi:SRSO17 transposase
MPQVPTCATAVQWATSLDEIAQRIGPRFPRAEPRQRARAYLQGLLSPVERKNGWQLAEQAGDRRPYGVQHLLGRATWDADAVRADLQAYVVEHLGDPDGVLIVDETGFLKKGDQSVGVQRQYSGTAGRIENCQIGVFLAYRASRGHTLLDRALYLPKAWTEDRARCRTAGVPDTVGFATKPRWAEQMIRRALTAGVPARWVTGDSVYGSDRPLQRFLEARQIGYVLGVTSDYTVRPHTAGGLAQALPKTAWQRLSAGPGSKGPRWYEWARYPLGPNEGEWDRWLLLRRSLDESPEHAYYCVSAPHGTTLPQMVAVAGQRWAVEECFALAKGECGLDEYEVRSWTGWHRHVTLSMLALAYLAVVRAQTNQRPEKGAGRVRSPRSSR